MRRHVLRDRLFLIGVYPPPPSPLSPSLPFPSVLSAPHPLMSTDGTLPSTARCVACAADGSDCACLTFTRKIALGRELLVVNVSMTPFTTRKPLTRHPTFLDRQYARGLLQWLRSPVLRACTVSVHLLCRL